VQSIKHWIFIITISLLSSAVTLSWANNTSPKLNRPFIGLKNYSQNLADWGLQLDPNYDQPISIKNPTMQNTVHDHYYGKHSVWEEQTEQQLTSQMNDIRTVEKSYLEYVDSQGNHINYYSNPNSHDPFAMHYKQKTSDRLIKYMDLDNQGSQYDPNRRGIVIQNANTRILPTMNGYYKNGKLPGEGPDFDYIQTTATWAGTPIYIVAYTTDKKWDLVLTGDCIGWIESDKVAMVNQTFIDAMYGKKKLKIMA